VPDVSGRRLVVDDAADGRYCWFSRINGKHGSLQRSVERGASLLESGTAASIMT
jgi:hypothetical protein